MPGYISGLRDADDSEECLQYEGILYTAPVQGLHTEPKSRCRLGTDSESTRQRVRENTPPPEVFRTLFLLPSEALKHRQKLSKRILLSVLLSEEADQSRSQSPTIRRFCLRWIARADGGP